MARVKFIKGGEALRGLMETMDARVRGRAVERDKNASGKTIRSMGYTTTITVASATGELEALSSWRYFGSGRGPGKRPPVEPLAEWSKARALASTEEEARRAGFAIARYIGEKGTKDFREKNPNVFIEIIDGMEDQIGDVVQRHMEDMDDGMFTLMENFELVGLS